MLPDIEVVGWDNSHFMIAGELAGVEGVTLESEVSGLIDPEFDFVTYQVADLPGSRYVGDRVQERHVIFKVLIEGANGRPWQVVDSEWRKAWSTSQPSRILVTTPLSGTRTLYAYLNKIEVDTTFDPHVNECATVTMDVVAYDPFWYGEDFTLEKTLSGSGTAQFYVPVANPGDVAISPIWVAQGGGTWRFPDVKFYPGSRDTDVRMVELPDLPDNQSVVVNTARYARQIVNPDNVNFWAGMRGKRWLEEIPPYTGAYSFDVGYSLRRAASCQLRLKRIFTRPWGLE